MEYQLSDIIIQTPIYVWFLFLFLLFVGIKALRSGKVLISRLLMMPLSFMVWSMFSMYQSYGANYLEWILWLTSYVTGFFILFLYVSKQRFQIDYQNSMIFIPGSYFSLIVSMSFFIFKYSMNVCYAINPSLKGDSRFFIIDIILSGMITGIFSGRVTALIAQYLNYKEKKY